MLSSEKWKYEYCIRFQGTHIFFKLLHNRIKARNLKAPWNVNLKHEVSKGHGVNKWLLFHQLSPCVYTLKYVCTMKRKSNLLVKHRRQLYRKTCVCRSGIWQRPKALRIWGHQNIFRLLCRRASAPSIYHVRLFQPLCEGRLETKNSLKKYVLQPFLSIHMVKYRQWSCILSIFMHTNNTPRPTLLHGQSKTKDIFHFL